MNRELDGYYFRVKREDKWENICFSDLTDEEMDKMLENRTEEWLLSLINGLKEVLFNLKDLLNNNESDLDNAISIITFRAYTDLANTGVVNKDMELLKRAAKVLGKALRLFGDLLDIRTKE